MRDDKQDYRSTWDFDLLGPTLKDLTTITSGTCTGRLFDAAGSNRVAVGATSGGSKVFLQDEPKLLAGDTVRISQESGTFHDSLVTSVDTDERSIIITTVTTAALIRGARVLRKIGSTHALLIFNAAGAQPNTKDWGFRKAIAPTESGIYADMTVHIEAVLDDGAGNIITRSKLVEFTDGV